MGFLTLVTGFLVLVGQMGMTGRVVSQGRTSLADWAQSVRRYSSRILALYVFFFAIVGGINSLFIALGFLFKGALTLPVIRVLNSFTYALNTSILYMLLAPAAVDDKGLGNSFDLGLTTVWRKSRVFLGYVTFVFVVDLSTRTLGSIDGYPTISSLTIISEAIRASVSPLSFLLAFLIYHHPTASTSLRD